MTRPSAVVLHQSAMISSSSRGERVSSSGRAVADDQGVFDPHPAAAGQVDPGLDGDDHARLQRTGPGRAEQRRLVDLQADAVPQPVHELVAVPRARDHLAGGGVDVDDLRPGRQPAAPHLLGGRDERVQVTLPAGGPADHHGAGHVGVVAVDQRAEVHLHQVPAAHRRVRRTVVRHRGVRTCGDDRRERRPLGAARPHARLQVVGDVSLAAPGTQAAGCDEVGERGVGDGACSAQRGRLGLVLDQTQAPHQARRAVQQHGVARGVHQRLVLVDGDDVRLEAQPGHPQAVRRARQHEGTAPVDHPLQVGDLPGALGVVAPVRAEAAGRVAVDMQQQRRVGTGEPGQVPDVHQIRDQQRFDVGGAQQPAQCRAAGGVGHARKPTVGTPRAGPGPAGRAAA